ncbi:MAG: hypothetical protein ACRDGG_00890 [Anaerolineae bacterium]
MVPAAAQLRPKQWLLRCVVHVGFAIALLATATHMPDRVRSFVLPALPIVRLWFDPGAQHRLHLGEVPYDLLRAADATLPRDAAVLLVTSGRDVRRLEYTTFHRALYFLAPRPVWWLSPAPPDGTWEARWWISASLTAESVSAIAKEKRAAYVLAYALPHELPIGRRVAEWEDGYLLQLDGNGSRMGDPPMRPTDAGALWPIQASFAIAAIFLLGSLTLRAIGRLGYHARGIEAVTLAWTLGTGLVSIGMLWLNALGISLTGQIVILTFVAVLGQVWNRRAWLAGAQHVGSVLREGRRLKPNLACVLLLGFFALQTALVTIMAVGQPLGGWDSWSSWGMRARTIFLDGSISPAVYADPSRASTLPYYPLLAPLVEAWLYGWLSAPDDRLVGVLSVLYYLALAGVSYSAVRRRGATRRLALTVAVVVASMPYVTLLVDFSFVDVPLAVLSTIAAVYLIDWLEGGSPGTLAIAALAAGLMPWTKREGLGLVVVLCLSALVVTRGSRRAWISLGSVLIAAALLSGPWWAFVAWNGSVQSEFLPITVETVQANLDRLPTIARMVWVELFSAHWSFVWPLAALYAVGLIVRRLNFRATTPVIRQTADALLLAAVLYLGLMSLSYIVSDFVPYEAHIASSFFRLVAQVVAWPVLWMAGRSLYEG